MAIYHIYSTLPHSVSQQLSFQYEYKTQRNGFRGQMYQKTDNYVFDSIENL